MEITRGDSMAISKITDAERSNIGVTGLPDTPGLSTSEIQQRFDGLGNLAIDKLNEIIDDYTPKEELEKERARIDSILGSGTGDNEGELIALQQEVSENSSKIATLQENDASIQDSIDTLNQKVNSIDESLTAITTTETF